MFFPLCILPSEPCMLSVDPGNCRSVNKRWYFDLKDKLCKRFNYGGCSGNANHFLSQNDCMTACSLTGKTFILGNLRASLTRNKIPALIEAQALRLNCLGSSLGSVIHGMSIISPSWLEKKQQRLLNHRWYLSFSINAH